MLNHDDKISDTSHLIPVTRVMTFSGSFDEWREASVCTRKKETGQAQYGNLSSLYEQSEPKTELEPSRLTS